MIAPALLGFILGLRHASDPDHVAALASIVARHERAWMSAAVGAAWGLGHGVTLVAAGAGIVLLELRVPARAALGLELAVGIVLVALGLRNLRDAGEPRRHAHAHVLAHGRVGAGLARSFGVGLVHGLAGSGAVALLALAAMPSPAASITYLAVFGLGTAGGMVAISLGLGVPVAFATRRPRLRRWIVAGSGALSLAFGAWMVYQIGVAQGLLVGS